MSLLAAQCGQLGDVGHPGQKVSFPDLGLAMIDTFSGKLNSGGLKCVEK